MLDLKKLNDILDSALESETAETLNRWIDEQIEADRAQGIIRDAGFGILNMYDKHTKILPLDKSIIEIGMSEYVRYDKVNITDVFDSTVLDERNLAS